MSAKPILVELENITSVKVEYDVEHLPRMTVTYLMNDEVMECFHLINSDAGEPLRVVAWAKQRISKNT